jgi:hypothetical protein
MTSDSGQIAGYAAVAEGSTGGELPSLPPKASAAGYLY